MHSSRQLLARIAQMESERLHDHGIINVVVQTLMQDTLTLAQKRAGKPRPNDRVMIGATRDAINVWRAVAHKKGWNAGGYSWYVKEHLGIDL